MKSMLWLCLAVIVLTAGCSFLNKVAPSKLDAEGNPIPGTHELSQPYKDISNNVPYADVVIGIGLLLWNGYERFRKNKYKSGLIATVQAIEAAGKDPDTKAEIARLKKEMETAHKAADVQPLINEILAKL